MVSSNDTREATELFRRKNQSDRGWEDGHSASLLICALLQEDEAEKAVEIFESSRYNPLMFFSSDALNRLMKHNLSLNRIDRALEVFEESKISRVDLDETLVRQTLRESVKSLRPDVFSKNFIHSEKVRARKISCPVPPRNHAVHFLILSIENVH